MESMFEYIVEYLATNSAKPSYTTFDRLPNFQSSYKNAIASVGVVMIVLFYNIIYYTDAQ